MTRLHGIAGDPTGWNPRYRAFLARAQPLCEKKPINAPATVELHQVEVNGQAPEEQPTKRYHP
jgi:hypothetical protein